MATIGRACVRRAVVSWLPLCLWISYGGSPATPNNATITITAGPTSDQLSRSDRASLCDLTNLIASLDVALGRCYFRSLTEPTQIDFAKASVRVEKTLNWKFE